MNRHFIVSALVGLVAGIALTVGAPAESQTYSIGTPVYSSAEWTVSHTEWCPGVAGGTFSGTTLSPRRSVTVDNRSTGTCYLTFDGNAATTTAAAAAEKLTTGEYRVFDLGSAITIKGACTVATASGACLVVGQYR